MFRAILLLQRERLKEMWWNKVAKTKRQPTSIGFFSIYDLFMIFTIFFTIFEIVAKTSKKPIKGVFRAILLLQRERLKEMWWNKVAKTKRQPTSIGFFSIYDLFTIFTIFLRFLK